MFAVLVEDQRSVAGFAEAGLTFGADRREIPARVARPLDTEAVAGVPERGAEEEDSRERSLEVVPADAAVEELGEVEAHYHI
jgi:hypothetical protein